MTQSNQREHSREGIREIRVVAALIRQHGKTLITQRPPSRHMGLAWEFPGGKVEEGETDAQALMRELREELGIDVQVGSKVFETRHGYGSREIHLLIYRCRHVSGEPRAIDVNDVEWIVESEIDKRNFLPADAPLVKAIAYGIVADEDWDVVTAQEEAAARAAANAATATAAASPVDQSTSV